MFHWQSYVFVLAVILNFSITIRKVKQGSLSILELVWGQLQWGGGGGGIRVFCPRTENDLSEIKMIHKPGRIKFNAS